MRTMKTYLESSQMCTSSGVVKHPRVVIENGLFAQVGSRDDFEFPAGSKVLNFERATFAPGYIDIHIHGGGGHDVMEATPEALLKVERSMAKHGVTSYLATTVTAPIPATLESLKRLGKWIGSKQSPEGRSVPLGVHLEGPFISHAKRGVHPPSHIQPPSIDLFQQMFDAAGGTVKLMTVAPEGVGAREMIAHAASKGVQISVGHSDATLAQTDDAIKAGARHATHVFNAMRALDHREPGILGAVLTDDRVSAEIIVDGVHVHPDIVKLLVQAKTAERVVLVTDAISATGMGDGTFQLGGFQVEVKGNRCEFEGRLAGSVLTLDAAVRNMAQFAEIPIEVALRMASLNPARLLGLSDRGDIKPGMVADLNVLDPNGEILKTFHAGC
jgi:N-acetylglucosamine-6-phosphate deacetylase